MITIKFTSGDTVKFNLKDPEREQELYNAWYSMSDTPKFGGKKLRIHTDYGEHIECEVREIEDCVYEQGMYEYSDAEAPKTESPKKVDVDFSEPLPDMPPEFYEKIQELMPVMQEYVSEYMKHIPEENKQKANIFLQRLDELGVSLDFGDSLLYETVRRVMHEEESRIEEHVQAYYEHWKKRQENTQ